MQKQLAEVTMILLLASLAFTAVGIPQLPDPGKASMGRQQQIQMGFQGAAQVYQQMPVLATAVPRGNDQPVVIPAGLLRIFQVLL